MLAPTSREVFFAWPFSPPWNAPSFTVVSTFSSPCSRSDSPLSCQGAALAHLDSLLSHHLVIWTDVSVPFPFGKSGSGVLANCSPCGTEITLTFSAGPVCSSFSLNSAGLGCTNKSAVSLLPLPDSRFVLVGLSSYVFFYLKLYGRSGRNCLFCPLLSGYNESPDYRFSRKQRG